MPWPDEVPHHREAVATRRGSATACPMSDSRLPGRTCSTARSSASPRHRDQPPRRPPRPARRRRSGRRPHSIPCRPLRNRSRGCRPRASGSVVRDAVDDHVVDRGAERRRIPLVVQERRHRRRRSRMDSLGEAVELPRGDPGRDPLAASPSSTWWTIRLASSISSISPGVLRTIIRPASQRAAGSICASPSSIGRLPSISRSSPRRR